MNAIDERAPNVSAALRRRVGAALDAGERPSLRGNNLRLGSVVLQRTDGRDAPALAEVEIQMRRRGLDTAGAFDTFAAATPVRRGRSTFATNTIGVEQRRGRAGFQRAEFLHYSEGDCQGRRVLPEVIDSLC